VDVDFPYVSGLMAFPEAPAILEVLRRLIVRETGPVALATVLRFAQE